MGVLKIGFATDHVAQHRFGLGGFTLIEQSEAPAIERINVARTKLECPLKRFDGFGKFALSREDDPFEVMSLGIIRLEPQCFVQMGQSRVQLALAL